MKIVIPFSGGVNSTYSLYRWLSETDADVLAYHSIDRWESEEANVEEFKRLEKVKDFLQQIRDFDFQTSEWPSKYVEQRIPIRPGFTNGTYDVGKVRPRYDGYIKWCVESNADAISIGLSLENTAMDCGYNTLRSVVEQDGVDIYLAGMPDLTPVAKGADFDWEEVSRNMIGRFEQYESLPEELQKLTQRHNMSTCDDVHCRSCQYQRSYEKFVSDGKTGRDLDLFCAKHGCYGPWRDQADPKTYLYRGGIGRDKSLPYLIFN
jgi:hypothetical protein